MHFGAVLDLGCGTGLAGAAFRPFADRLVGVDLAPAMIAQAANKNLYDHLVTVDLAAFLGEAIAKNEHYDLVLAADVFVYINDIAPIVAAASRALARNGLLAFTVETHPGTGAKLLPTLRYAYSADFLRAILTDAALVSLKIEAAQIRTEKNEPVAGLVVVAARQA